MLSSSKRAQIVIFILIALMIIFLFIILISGSFEGKKEIIEDAKTNNRFETNSKLFPIKDQVDFCLDKGLKKALVLSGLRGGFLYAKGEPYITGAVPTSYLGDASGSFLEVFDITSGFAKSRTLLTSRDWVFTPGLESSTSTNYSRSIKGDFEQFILEEFGRCFDLDKYRDAGYDVHFENFSSFISQVNIQTLTLDKDIGDIGEQIQFTLEDKEYRGEIVEANRRDIEEQIELFGPVNFAGIDPRTVKVINLNKSPQVYVSFEDERVVAFLQYPFTVTSEQFSSSFKDSSLTSNVRFKKLLDMAKLLLEEKYYDNKSGDPSNEDFLIEALSSGFYFKRAGDLDIEVVNSVKIDRDDYKRNVFSIIDSSSKIYGQPYVFNVGYENSAPFLDDLTTLGTVREKSNGDLVFFAVVDDTVTLDLRETTKERQVIDLKNYYYEPLDFQDVDKRVKLTSNGILEYTALREGISSFTVRVTDSEAFNEYTFVFMAQAVENENNEDARSCFDFVNYQNDDFPMEPEFKNSIFVSTDENSGYKTAFAYALAQNEITAPKVNFLPECLLNQDDFMATYTIKSESGSILSTGTFNGNSFISLPSNYGLYPLTIDANIVAKSDSSFVLNTVPFRLKVFGTSCLGPHPATLNLQDDLGGTLSCCDTSVLKKNGEGVPSASGLSNIFNGVRVLDADMYFRMDFNSNLGFYDANTTVMWEDSTFGSVASSITSLFNAKVTGTCRGTYPRFEQNIDALGSGSYTMGEVEQISTGIYSFNINNIPLRLDLEQQAGICEFAYIDTSRFSFVLDSGVVFEAGLVDENSGSLSGITHLTTEEDGYFDTFGDFIVTSTYLPNVLCDDSVWQRSSDGVVWDTTYTGSNEGQDIHVSRGYCAQSSSLCLGKENSPSYDLRRDVVSDSECSNWFFVNSNLLPFQRTPYSITQVCGQDQQVVTCSGGGSGVETYEKVCSADFSCSVPTGASPVLSTC